MRHNSKHLNYNEVTALSMQTDGRTTAGWAINKATSVLNALMCTYFYKYLFL